MDVPKCYLVVTFLLSLQCTDGGGSCQENIYLEVGKQGIVPCHFENFDIIGWIHGTGDVTNTSPFIYMDGSQIYGRGYESGDYDMHPNGSLIINEVKLNNEFNYTVLFDPHPAGGTNQFFEILVKVYGGSCQENIYLEVGKQGVVSCHFQNFDIIAWINGDGDVTNTPPFIYMEGSQIYGRGYESGDYDMHPNGSLIISEIKLTNEFNYTVLFDPHPAGGNEYFKVPVKVYVPPDRGYPVVNGRANQVVVLGNTRGFINCSLTGVRPRVDLEWVFSQDEISLDSSHRVTDNNDGTYNTYLSSSYKVVNSPTGRVSLICRVAGQMADLFPLVTTVYMLLEQRFPVVNGLTNQQHVVLDVNRDGELTCSMDKVSQDVFLELVTIFLDSSDEILLDNKYHITVNGDDTVNITLTSKFRVLSDSTQHFTLQCRVSGQAADKYPEATTVELLVTETTSMLPVPVIDGCYSQVEACTLMMTTEETITCCVKGVPHHYDLNLALYTLPDLLRLSHITDRIDTHPSGYYDIITSCRYIVDEPIIDTMVHCFLSGTDRNIQPVNSTVKAKIIWQATDQELESLLSWQSNLSIVLLVFLAVNVTIFWLVFVFWMEVHKGFARKYHWSIGNPGQQTDLQESDAADHQSIQELQTLNPGQQTDLQESDAADHQIIQELQTLQPVSNKDAIEKCNALLSYLKRQSLTDSGVSSGLNSIMASGTRSARCRRN